MKALYPYIAPPDHIMALVACVGSWWQQFEFFIDAVIWRWAGLSQKRGRCITHHMPLPLKCTVLCSLSNAKFSNDDYDKALNKFVENHIKPAHNVRNRFAHALWLMTEAGKPFVVEKPFRQRHQIEGVEINQRELLAAGAKILGIGAALMELVADFEEDSFSPQAWQKKLHALPNEYDHLLAERARHRATPDKPPRPPRSSGR